MIIKQIRDPLQRREEIKKNAAVTDSNRSNISASQPPFRSTIARQMERNQTTRQMQAERRRLEYIRKMEQMKQQTEENLEIMLDLQEKEMTLLQSVQEYTQISQQCETKLNAVMNQTSVGKFHKSYVGWTGIENRTEKFNQL
jgi:hypothetical protein